jgi:hypothetical protein
MKYISFNIKKLRASACPFLNVTENLKVIKFQQDELVP